MKLSDLKPCACCGGPLLTPPAGNWYVVRVTTAMLNPRAAQQVQGVAAVLGRNLLAATYHDLRVIETMSPMGDDAVMILGDQNRDLMTELHVCLPCMMKFGPLLQLIEKEER